MLVKKQIKAPKTTTVRIMGREYHAVCSDEEKEALLQAACYLDAKMHEIHANGKIVGTERIAVMAALNIAHELLQSQQQDNQHLAAINQQINTLNSKIEEHLD